MPRRDNDSKSGGLWIKWFIPLSSVALVSSFSIDSFTVRFCNAVQPAIYQHRLFWVIAAHWLPLLILPLTVFAIYKTPMRKSRLALELIMILFSIFIACQILHSFIHIQRPFVAMSLPPLFSQVADFSFPSDQISLGTSAAIIVSYEAPITGCVIGIITFLLGIFQALTLLYWPSDVVAGFVIGAFLTKGIQWLRKNPNGWLNNQKIKAVFDSEEAFSNFVTKLRLLVVIGVLIRFEGQYDSLKTLQNISPDKITTSKILITILCGGFFLYTILTNAVLIKHLQSIRTASCNGNLAPKILFEKTTWKVIFFDYLFYAIFYVITGSPESNIFCLFLVPIIGASLLKSPEALARAFGAAIGFLSFSIFSIYALGFASYAIFPDVFPKEWLALNVLLPKVFILGFCCLPMAWLEQRRNAIERERALYASLVNHLPPSLMITRKDLTGIITYANGSFRALNSQFKKSFVGATDFDLYPTQMAEIFQASDQIALKRKQSQRIDEKHRSFGAEKDIEVAGWRIPVCDENGQVIEIQIIFWDATQRRQREAKFDALMDTLPDHIYFKDLDSSFLEISESLSKWFGLSDRSQAIGNSDKNYFSASEAATKLKIEQEIIATGDTRSYLENQHCKDGSWMWVMTTKKPLRDRQHRIIGTFGISHNIQELIRVQEDLRVAKSLVGDRLKRASAIAQLGFWEYDLLDDEATRVDATDEVYRIFCVPIEQKGGVKFTHLRDKVHPEDRHIWDNNFSRARTAPPFPACEFRLLLSDNTIKYLYAKCEVERYDRDGLPRTVVGVVQDISDRKRDQFKVKGLELVIEGFVHMIPGTAIETVAGFELTEDNASIDDSLKRGLYFSFMVKHKAHEVQTILSGKPEFPSYELNLIWERAWPIALDFARLDLFGLEILYGAGTDKFFRVPGSCYTVAINILSNARKYGKPPYVVWSYICENKINIVFADGGLKDMFKSQKPPNKGTKVGIRLVERILEIQSGSINKLTQDDIKCHFPQVPERLTTCETFYKMTIPMQ